jgi:hypothetical protein
VIGSHVDKVINAGDSDDLMLDFRRTAMLQKWAWVLVFALRGN